MTRPYAEVIGDPISHSKSPLIHNFWLGKLGIEAEYRACHVTLAGLADYFARRREDAKWRGCNVTIPHKQAVLNHVDDCRGLGLLDAANTIAPRPSGLAAWNTDVVGVLTPLGRFRIAESMPVDDRNSTYVSVAQIIGAGGAARAAIEGASLAGYFQLEIFNRSLERAQETAAQASISRRNAYDLAELKPLPTGGEHPFAGYDCHYLIINASPMGMAGYPPVPIDLCAYPADTVVFDMVYAPLETQLLVAARERGLRTIDGLEMLVAQASAAFEIFFGQPAPRQHDVELRALLTA